MDHNQLVFPDEISESEKKIITMSISGFKVKHIAAICSIQADSVTKHKTRAKIKTGFKTDMQLAWHICQLSHGICPCPVIAAPII